MNKKSIFDLKRDIVKLYLTAGFKKVIEEEDKIICYVEKSNCKKRKNCYVIACRGMEKAAKSLAKEFKLNKPIYYIIDGLSFNKKKVHIWGYNQSNVIIQNCKFNYGLQMHISGNCLVENTHIYHPYQGSFLSADRLTLKNTTIKSDFSFDSSISINFNTDMSIISSNIETADQTTSIAGNGSVNLVDSKIKGSKVECHANDILCSRNSLLIAKENVDIKANSFDQLTISSPNITYNDSIVKKDEERIVLTQDYISSKEGNKQLKKKI